MKQLILLFLLLTIFSITISAQPVFDLKQEIEQLQKNDSELDHKIYRLEKLIDDVLWYNKVGDIAHIDKLYIVGPPKWKEENPTAKDAGNPV